MKRTFFALGNSIALTALSLLCATCGPANAQQKTVKVAYIGPLTGANTAMGIGTRNAMELAFRQANASGKLPFKIELVSETDDSKPSTGVAAVRKICEDPDVVAASAHWNSPVALATMRYFQDCGMLNLIAGAAADELTQKGIPEIGRVSTPMGYTFAPYAERLFKGLNIKAIAVLKSRDALGELIANGFAAEYQKLGGKILVVEAYNVGDRDFTASLTKMAQLKPDAVFLSGATTEAALVARQMRQLGMTAHYVGTPAWQTATFVEAAGPAAQGAIVVTALPFLDELPGGQQFAKDYALAGFKEPHETYGPYGYVAGQVIVELLRQHGPDRKAIVAGLRKLTEFETIFGKISFDRDGEMQPKHVGLAIVKGKEWEKYSK